MITFFFRIHPFARLFFIVVLIWVSLTMLYAAGHMPLLPALPLIGTACLILAISALLLRGLNQMLNDYGRTWIGRKP